jgi:hypothetical protein
VGAARLRPCPLRPDPVSAACARRRIARSVAPPPLSLPRCRSPWPRLRSRRAAPLPAACTRQTRRTAGWAPGAAAPRPGRPCWCCGGQS